MTTPTPPDPALIQQHELVALALEAEAVQTLAAPVSAAVAAVLAWMHVEYLAVFGTSRDEQSGLRFQLFTQRVASKLRGVRRPQSPQLLDYARQARTLGVEQGLREAGQFTEDLADTLDQAPSQATRETVDAALGSAGEKVQAAQRHVAHVTAGTLADVEAAVMPAQQAANALERDLVSLVHASLNDGLAAAVKATDGRLLWLAERDACTVCLPLSGMLADDNGEFDWTLTFGAKAYPPKAYNDAGQLVEIPLRRPGRHPLCRCRVTWWYGDRTPGPNDFPTALRREAERSILNGYALPSEPVSTRIHAAEALLKRIGAMNSRSPSGWQVPTTVQQRARTRLKTGRFTTQPVPDGR